MRNIAAICLKAQKFYGLSPIYILHLVESFLNSHHTQHLSSGRLTFYEILLLSPSNVIMVHCHTLNPAS